jgi:hypothetical protein
VTTILRPGARVLFDGEVGVPTIGHVSCHWWKTWWDPDNEGLPIWGAWQAKGAPSQALSYKDLSGNGRDLGVGSAPSWSKSAGWAFNGSSHYLTTTFKPDSDQSQAMIIQFTDFPAGQDSTQKVAAGVTNGPGDENFSIQPGWNDTWYYGYRNGHYIVKTTGQKASGNFCVSGTYGYYNGSEDASGIGAWANPPGDYYVYIGGRNTAGSLQYPCPITITAIAIYSGTLTGTQVAKVASAMADI